MAKSEYHGKDFFQRKEFRGLLLADYQEAIGEKAFQCVDQLNTNTVSQFSDLGSFKEALSKRKQLDKFYKHGGIRHYTSMQKHHGGLTDSKPSPRSISPLGAEPTTLQFNNTQNLKNIPI